MHSEDELLPLSGLQHVAFCVRQWALIHLERVWQDNRLTAQGSTLHEMTDTPGLVWEGPVLIARAVRVRSLTLGVSGIADVIEFHPERPDVSDETGEWSTATVNEVPSALYPFPVEYKRGKPKIENWDRIQLCAQAICLEEMLDCSIAAGAIFYGQPRRREHVTFTSDLRDETAQTAQRMHELWAARRTPSVFYEPKCKSCSIYDWCLPPRRTKRRDVSAYVDAFTQSDESDSKP